MNHVYGYDERLRDLPPVEKNVRAQILRTGDVDFAQLTEAIRLRQKVANDPSSVICMRDGPRCFVSWRTLLTGSSGAGAELISGGAAKPGIDKALAAQTVLGRIGAVVETGATSDLVEPVETGTWSASFVQEDEEVATSDASITGRKATPHRIAVLATVSTQILTQRQSFNQFVRDRLLDALARGIDRAALQGDGVVDPRGIYYHPDIPVITAGAAFSLSTFEDLENSLLTNNVEVDSLRGVVGTAVRAKLRQKATDAGAGSFLLSVNNGDSGLRENLMGVPSVTTTLTDADSIILGDFSRLKVNLWGNGFQLVIDPYARKQEGLVEFYAEAFADVAITQPNAFAICKDAAL